MREIKAIIINKIWGYEKWIHSPLKENFTIFKDSGVPVTSGPLIKIIKTIKPLSIQVHPDDKLAISLENMQNGKAESWYIIEEDNTEMIIGLNNYDEDFIKKSFKNKTFHGNLKTISVKPKDFINVPAGLVHGIGSNVKVLEIQQPSDITYRYYDYDRLESGQPRELHVEKALKSQKDLDWRLTPEIIGNNKIYRTKYYSQEYGSGKKTLESNAIVIDIDSEVAYVANKGESFDFEHYCIVVES